jgi:hypothetical protein
MEQTTEPKIITEGTDPIETFVKIRTDSIEVFKDTLRDLAKDKCLDGHDLLVGSAAKAIDHALSSALTEVQDNFLGFVASVEKTEVPGEVHVDIRLKANLAQSYFDQVSS